MEAINMQQHWDSIYQTKQLCEVSWYQPVPETSLRLIDEAGIEKDAAIIDVGGGDSLLADHLLEKGYTNITVLDISEAALDRAKKRLGENAGKVKWITADISKFKPEQKYDVWHDRAAFHFLTNDANVQNYSLEVSRGLKESGTLIIGTFSEDGPKKCSGVEIKQYSQEKLAAVFSENFRRLNCFSETHTTPFNTVQEFTFCVFKKNS